MMFRSNSRLSNTSRPTLYIPNNNNHLSSAVCPPGISSEPKLWGREDVRTWLIWCLEEFALEDVDLEKFSMNGKALCMLKKGDFNDRAKNGDVLFNALQELISFNKTNSVSYNHQHGSPMLPGTPEALYDGVQVSPHDLVTESPLVAASPPVCVISKQRHANVPLSMSRQSSIMTSRSPSPNVNSPLDLSCERDQDASDDSSSSTHHEKALNLSTPPVEKQMSGFSYPVKKIVPNLSPGSRSPARRPSPSGDVSPVPMKLKRGNGSDTGSPGVLYPNNNYLLSHEMIRESSSEQLHGLHQKMAMARLDSHGMDGHPSPSRNLYFAGVNGGTLRERVVKAEADVDDPQEIKTYHIYPLSDQDAKQDQIPLTVNNVDQIDDSYDPDMPEGEAQGDTKLLWEFIYQLLKSPEYTSLVRWEDEERLVFRIVNPAELAKLWGLQKSRGNMTYEKLSRALRYYYKMNIIVKEPQRRLTYRFVKPPESIQRGQKGAKPGVSHKKRSSNSPTPSPRTSSPSPSPLSCSPSSPSPIHSHPLTPPLDKFTAPHYFALPNDGDSGQGKVATAPISSPKTYSPITARAYFNLCRQYSMDKSRPAIPSWPIPPNSIPSGEERNSLNIGVIKSLKKEKSTDCE